MPKVLWGLAVAAGVLGLFAWLRADDPQSAEGIARRNGAATAAIQGRHSAEVVLAISPGVRPAVARPEGPKRSPLMQEVLAATSYRALFDRLREKPARTGEEDYVLARILEFCGLYTKLPPMPGHKPKPPEQQREEFLQAVSPDDPVREKRVAAYDRARGRAMACHGFEDVKTAPREVRAILERAAAAGDPKAQAAIVEQDVFASVRPFAPRGEGMPPRPQIAPEQVAALQRAAESGDPSAIETAGRVFASTIDNLVVRVGPDGQAVDPRAFHDAWVLAACEFGLDCGPDHRMVLQGCAHRGNCGASTLREHMFYYEHSPRQSQLINDYHASLVGAIRGRDWTAITFQHGARPTGGHFMFGGGWP